MSVTQIATDLYQITLGGVNAFLIDENELILVDTGNPGSSQEIIAAIESIGRHRNDLKHILVTHSHPDHAGSLAELKQMTGAVAYMHPAEATITEIGKLTQDMSPAPGMEEMFKQFIGFGSAEYEPVKIEHQVNDGDEIPLANGLTVIHAPGHCTGQIVLFWSRHRGVLFAADTCSNMMGLGYSLGYQDFETGMHTLSNLCELNFEIACFGHGAAITKDASQMFNQKWQH